MQCRHSKNALPKGKYMTPQQLDIYLRTMTELESQNNPHSAYDQVLDYVHTLPGISPEKYQTLLDLQQSGDFQDLDFWDTVLKLRFSLSDFQSLLGIYAAKQDRFTEVESHYHEWIELAYIYSGSCTLTIHDQELTLYQGECVLINSNVAHSCHACGENDILVNILIQQEYLDQNFFNRFSEDSYLSQLFMRSFHSQKASDSYLLFHSGKSRRLPLFMTEFLCEYFDKGPHSKDYLDSYITLILLELTDIYSKTDASCQKEDRSQQIVPILRYIEENFSTCTLTSTAVHFGMNPNYLSNFIKKHTGHTFKYFVQNQKLLCGARLLQSTTLSVTEVSVQSGYENVSFFYKKFREKFHCSPLEYRQKNSQPGSVS